MQLTNTAAYMEKRAAEGFLDTYIIEAGRIGGERAVISRNAGEDTLFDAASMGKVFVTSTLILQALGEGRLALEDGLEKFFPEVPEDKRGITVRQLLTHTSGIVREHMPDAVIDGGKEPIQRFLLTRPLAFPIGSSYTYSCYGYILLGYIVEKVFGKPLDAVFNERLRQQLGYTRCCFNPPLDTRDIAVTHYRPEAGDCLCADDIVFRMKGVAGNGASFWTLRDIRTFLEAVERKAPTLYPEALFALAEQDYTPHYAEGRGLGYQLVDGRYPQTGRLFPEGSFGHCGNTGASFFLHRETGLYTIILTNAMRFRYMECNYHFEDYNREYGKVMAMRADIHNAIWEDMRG